MPRELKSFISFFILKPYRTLWQTNCLSKNLTIRISGKHFKTVGILFANFERKSDVRWKNGDILSEKILLKISFPIPEDFLYPGTLPNMCFNMNESSLPGRFFYFFLYLSINIYPHKNTVSSKNEIYFFYSVWNLKGSRYFDSS